MEETELEVKALENRDPLTQEKTRRLELVRTRTRIQSLEYTRDIAAAELSKAKTVVARTEADLKYRGAEVKRVEDLVNKNALEPRMLDEEREHFSIFEAAANEARAGVKAAEIRIIMADEELKRAHVNTKPHEQSDSRIETKPEPADKNAPKANSPKAETPQADAARARARIQALANGATSPPSS